MEPARDRLRFELALHRAAGVRHGIARATEPELAADSARRPVAESESALDRAGALEALCAQVRTCEKCKLCAQRNRAVPGEGALDPPILFVGEGPGREEDRTGRPFVGAAGQLLEKMIAAIGLARADVYIANIVKCRPPKNRVPELDEIKACLPYLERQLELVRPGLICTLGLPSTRTLVPSVRSISAARGKLVDFRGTPLIPTFHPAYLLRQPRAKRHAWEDLKLIARLALGKQL